MLTPRYLVKIPIRVKMREEKIRRIEQLDELERAVAGRIDHSFDTPIDLANRRCVRSFVLWRKRKSDAFRRKVSGRVSWVSLLSATIPHPESTHAASKRPNSKKGPHERTGHV